MMFRISDLDDEPLHSWVKMDEDALRAYAAQHVGWATNEMADPASLAWRLDHDFDVTILSSLPTDWRDFHQEEVVDNPNYGDGFSSARYHTPIVVSIEHGQPIIWDGWHRAACAIARGDATMMAIVGTMSAKTRKRKSASAS